MTDVEFARLFAELSATATSLNKASDAINGVISGFEDKLRHINLGLAVWLVSDPISTEVTQAEDAKGEAYDSGEDREELGFTKLGDTWSLATRIATYRYTDPHGYGKQAEFRDASGYTRLLECSRKVRIDAIKRFPALVKLMNAEGLAAVEAIEAAKKLVD